MKKTVILIDDIIGKDWWTGEGITAKDVRSKVTQGEADGTVNEFEVLINSPGGSFMDGTSMYNIIEGITKPTNIHIEGIAASWAANIAFAKGKPTMAPNALIMLHTASTGMWGNSQDFREAADVLDKFDETLAVSISQHIGLTVQEVKDLYLNHKDNWLTAQEAEAAGLVTIKGKATSNVEDVKDLSLDQVFARFAAKHNVVEKPGFLDLLANKFKNFLPSNKAEKTPTPDTLNPDDTMKINVTSHAAIIAALGIKPAENAVDVDVEASAEIMAALNKKLEEGAQAATNLTAETKKATDATAKLKEVTDELAAIKANPAGGTQAKSEKEVENNADPAFTYEDLSKFVGVKK